MSDMARDAAFAAVILELSRWEADCKEAMRWADDEFDLEAVARKKHRIVDARKLVVECRDRRQNVVTA